MCIIAANIKTNSSSSFLYADKNEYEVYITMSNTGEVDALAISYQLESLDTLVEIIEPSIKAGILGTIEKNSSKTFTINPPWILL